MRLPSAFRGAQEPETAISPISSGAALTLPPKGTQRASEPTARTAFSIDTRSLAIVISRTGRAQLAALDQPSRWRRRRRCRTPG